MFEFPESWIEILEDELNKDYFIKLQQHLDIEYRKYTIYPPKNEIFNCLKFTNYDDIKCVILAQDPYPGVDKNNNRHAHGLAFSSQSIYEIPKSLQNIYKELSNSVKDFKKPQHANLEKWARQGVLLLNSSLTVQAGMPNSHSNIGWQKFTNTIIQKLGENDSPIVFCLWGAYAQKSKQFISNENKLILEASHPSPLSARHSFFQCNHFNLINDYLIKHHLKPINWQI